MPSYADIYASCLYAAGEGLPLWNPSPLRLGDVGYVRDGSFIVLFNAIDGPGTLSDAANIHLARRYDRSVSRERVRRQSATMSETEVDGTDDVPAAVANSSRRSSLATSSVGCSSSTPVAVSSPATSDSHLPSSSKFGSPTFAHRKLRSGTPPQGAFPPMPLAVDQEKPKLFDMGPRMSSTYRCLGLDVGTSVPGSPVSIKIGFESSGGDGAILIPRDPTERTRLKYLGVLKAYIKAHHKWMYDTYGRIESIGVDDIALIYGQDRTSDWAVAVSRDAARGAKVEFEIFGNASAGFWGNWSHTLSACQRGPHRPQSEAQVPPGLRAEGEGSMWGMNLAGGTVNASFSFSSSSSTSPHEEEHTRGRRRSPPSRAHSVSWSPDVHAAPDQTISIRRVTACTSLGLGFLPARPKAAAEPRDPDFDPKKDRACDAVTRHDGDAETTEPLYADLQWHDDPLEALHAWIHERGGAQVKVSIASDDDCLQLLALLRDETAVGFGLRNAVCLAADRFARISVDDSGFATISTQTSSVRDKNGRAIVRSAVPVDSICSAKGLPKPRVMLPCRSIPRIGSASPSLVLH